MALDIAELESSIQKFFSDSQNLLAPKTDRKEMSVINAEDNVIEIEYETDAALIERVMTLYHRGYSPARIGNDIDISVSCVFRIIEVFKSKGSLVSG